MRRLSLFLAVLAACAVLLAATIPWWLGGALRPLARLRGAAYGTYERIGYTRFALHDVEVAVGPVRVRVDRVEADTPLLWLWRHWRGRDGLVAAGSWQVEVAAPSGPSAPDRPRGWLPLRSRLQVIAAGLDAWLPQAVVGAGVVRWPGDEVTLAAARWHGRELAVDGLTFRNVTVEATLGFPADDVIRFSARTRDGVATAKLESHGSGVNGEAELWQQRAAVGARFSAQGWLPEEGSLEASAWTIPGEKVRLGDAYRDVRGDAQVSWRESSLDLTVSATGEPQPGRDLPPLEVALRATGDQAGFTLETLRLAVPGVAALLSEPVAVGRDGRLRDGRARFTVQADLAQLPGSQARGTVTGEANVISGDAGAPVVEFSVVAADLQARGVPAGAADVRGRLDWPRLEIVGLAVHPAEGGEVTGRGGWDFGRRELVAAKVTGELRRATLARWMPDRLQFDTVRLAVEAAGPLGQLEHRGSLQAKDVGWGRLQPLDLAGEWRGTGTALEAWSAEMRAGTAEIAARGSTVETGLTVAAASLRQDGGLRLELDAPVTVRWRPGLQIDGWRLSGPEGRIQGQVTLGPAGRIELVAERIAAAWFRDFVSLPGPEWTVSRLGLAGSWPAAGPAQFNLDAAVGLEIGDGRTARIDVRAAGAADGTRIEHLRITESDETVVDARGRLPFAWRPRGETPLAIDPAGPLTLAATVAPHPVFWTKFAALTGVALEEPRAEASLGGTWARPEGRAVLRAGRVTIEPRWTERPVPVIEELDLEVDGDRRGLNLTRFHVKVAGQEVRARGRLPVPEDRWRDLVDRPFALARGSADLQVDVPDAELAALARFLPATVAPKGRFQAEVRYRNGGLEGFLRLRDAASRPLGPLGVVQDVHADVLLDGRRLELQEVTAQSGGQPVRLSGEVELAEDGAPRYDLALRGSNLPFVRQTGLLLRGDLDLRLQTPADGAPTRLSGSVRLRDSLFLSDVRSLLPQSGAGPARRPPYFAVDIPPVGGWTLAVDVTGDRFMRVRIPVFNGVASARFRLGGTLGEPRAIGELVIDEGQIRMPFAGFTVTQGMVRLTEFDEFEPEIYLRGTGRRYGYDLSLLVEGPAAHPNVVFSSSPALDSEQVLLMVMAGTAPGNEISRTATQRAANLGLFLGQSLLSSLGADAAEADRLSFVSGEKVSRQGRETYGFEYQLSDRWTLTGEYNEFDEYNAGVKWRVFGGRRPVVKSDDAK